MKKPKRGLQIFNFTFEILECITLDATAEVYAGIVQSVEVYYQGHKCNGNLITIDYLPLGEFLPWSEFIMKIAQATYDEPDEEAKDAAS